MRCALAAMLSLGGVMTMAVHAQAYDPVEKSIATLQADMTSGAVTSEGLTRAYLDRIDAIDRSGPTLRSVLSINPNALEQARALDEERANGAIRGPLHGVPILLKDNIETKDPIPTTAGSLALKNNVTGRDAPVAARLREAGAVILGKTNLSEWANIRDQSSISGWSSLGGLTKNAYVLDRNACGSSSGSGVAAAASLAAASIGTETDGSIMCPSNMSGLVGIKPTVGLVSRRHIVPISQTQDTAGPMARSVSDAAILLTAIAGTDPEDPVTAEADIRKKDYAEALNAGALQDARIGVLRFEAGFHRRVDAAFEAAIAAMQNAGATIKDIQTLETLGEIGRNEWTLLLHETKADITAYLETSPADLAVRSLDDVIAFNAENAGDVMPFFGQGVFELAAETDGLDAPAYLQAKETAFRLAGPEGIDALLAEHEADVLIAPTGGPAWVSDLATGDHFLGASSTLAAVSGYPSVTVPMGDVFGLPIGMSFIGPKWSEAALIGYAYAFEQAAQARRPPEYLPSLASAPDAAPGVRGLGID